MNPENDKERSAETETAVGTTPPDDGSRTQQGGAAGEPIARPGTADVQAYIGRQLRAVYDDVVKQPIPDRFLDLMKQLEKQGRQD
jgi:hypothetical protein